MARTMRHPVLPVPAVAMLVLVAVAAHRACAAGQPTAVPAQAAAQVNRAGTFPEPISSWGGRGLPAGPAVQEGEPPPPKWRLRLGMDVPLRTDQGGFKGAGFQGSVKSST